MSRLCSTDTSPSSARARALRTMVAESLARGRPLTLVTESGSMRPLLPPGARIRIVPKAPPFAIGDVVLRRLPSGEALLHRIIIVDGERVITKGDAAAEADSPCSQTDLLGVAIAVDGHRLDTPAWRAVNRLIARLSPHSDQLRAPLRLAGRLRRRLGLTWL